MTNNLGVISLSSKDTHREAVVDPSVHQALYVGEPARYAWGASAPSLAASSPIIPNEKGKVQVAAFDFDGTTITGNSPVLLVRHLVKTKQLSKSVVARILLWGAAYKLRLPQNESWVRGLVFSAFAGKAVETVNTYLAEFYHNHVASRFRPAANEAMEAHVKAGHAVIWVSASFEPIILEAMKDHWVHYEVSTRMAIDSQGNYTNKVEGLPIEGAEKIVALTALCDALFGKDGWELGWAYGDHHSDITLLEAARIPYAVTPDNPLERAAKRRGWEILSWNERGGE